MAETGTKINQQLITKFNCKKGKNLEVSTSSDTQSKICHYPKCGKVFEETLLFADHLRSHRPHSCDWQGCDKKFTHKSGLKEHMLIHTGEKNHVCDICGKKFLRKNDLRSHIIICEKKVKCFCPNCQVIGGNKIVNSKGRKLHSCNYENCGKNFESTPKLVEHLWSHTGERPYACKWEGCDQNFINKKNLKIHMLKHTGERPYVCVWPGCEKNFNKKYNLKIHRLVHTGEKNYFCNFCDFKCYLKSNLKRHLEAHDKYGQKVPYYKRPSDCQCPNCQFVLAGNEEIKDSKNRRLHNCHYENCDRVYPCVPELIAHLRSHTGERPYKCESQGCGKKFMQPRHLKVHMLTHSKERQHACIWKGCEKKFTQKANLKAHMVTHTGEKKYACQICSFRSMHKSNLKQHINKIHNKSSFEKEIETDDLTTESLSFQYVNVIKLEKIDSDDSEKQIEISQRKFSEQQHLQPLQKSTYDDIQEEIEFQDVKIEPKEEPQEQLEQ